MAFIDDRPDEIDLRNILLGGLQRANAVVLFGNIRVQDLAPDCPKNAKDIPAGGCVYRPEAK